MRRNNIAIVDGDVVSRLEELHQHEYPERIKDARFDKGQVIGQLISGALPPQVIDDKAPDPICDTRHVRSHLQLS
jgi:hypothetical protein